MRTSGARPELRQAFPPCELPMEQSANNKPLQADFVWISGICKDYS